MKPYRDPGERASIAVDPLPFTMKVVEAIRRSVTSNAGLWMMLSVPIVLAYSYVDGAELRFVLMRLTLALAVIPTWVLLGRAFKALG